MDAGVVGVGHRRRRSVAGKLQIVQLTLEPGASVAEVGRAHGVNANQLFKWRRQYERGQLGKAGVPSTALLPVTISADDESTPETTADVQSPSGGVTLCEHDSILSGLRDQVNNAEGEPSRPRRIASFDHR
jgi:transposase